MGCLTGKAASAVVGYRGGNNYGNVVATLTRLFGDQRVIKEALQAELINLPSCTDSVDSLQVFVENLERTCRQLVALGQPVDSSILCQVVKSKLPRSILTEVVKAERAEGRQWGVAELRTGLAEIAAIKAEVQRCAGPTQTQKREGLGGKPVDKGRAFIAGAKESIKGNNKGCLFCSKTHKSAECTQYKGRKARRQRLTELKRCFKCLGIDHWANQCSKDRKCTNCGDARRTIHQTQKKWVKR